MTDYHLATFVTNKDVKEVSSPHGKEGENKMRGTSMSKRKMFQDALEKGKESEFADGEEHGGSRRIYFANKAGKQSKAESDHAKISDIFRGCKIFNNSGRDPHQIKSDIERHGGRVVITRGIEPYTHYMTNELTDTEKRQEAAKPLKDKHAYHTVTEAWVYDSIRAGKRLIEADYSPHGRVSMNIGQFMCTSTSTSTSSSAAKGEQRGRDGQDKEQEKDDGGEPTIEANPALFLKQYLSNSRLHFLGTWRDRAYAIYKAMCQFQGDSAGAGHAPTWLPTHASASGNGVGSRPRVVLHADMDCFFVTAALVSADKTSLLENVCPGAGPLRKVPVAVSHGHDEAESEPSSVPQTDSATSTSAPNGTNNGVGGGKSPPPQSKSRHVHAEVSSCNYSAREQGVRAGMSLGRARSLCPDLQVVPYAFEAYGRLSALVYEVLLSFGADHEYRLPSSSSSSSSSLPKVSNGLSHRCRVEVVSVDEAFLELPRGSDGPAAARQLAARVLELTGCRMSIGVGANKLLARLATRKAKPPNALAVFCIDDHAASEELHRATTSAGAGGGDTFAPSHSPSPSATQPTPPSLGAYAAGTGADTEGQGEEVAGLSQVVRAFLLRVKLSELPGVGYKTQRALAQVGLVTCRDVLRAESQRQLESQLRKNNTKLITREVLLRLCKGEDSRALTLPEEGLLSKSIAVEVTWGVRFSRLDRVELFMHCVCEEVQRRLQLQRQQGNVLSFRKVTVKVMKRHPDVPQTNTPALLSTVLRGSKYMGHGKALNFSKTLSIPHGITVELGPEAEGRAAQTLAREVLALLASLRSDKQIDVVDLRGLGVQVSDFSSSSSSSSFASSSSSSFASSSSAIGARRGGTLLDHFSAPPAAPQRQQDPPKKKRPAKELGQEEEEEDDKEGDGEMEGLTTSQVEVLAALTDPADRAAVLRVLRDQRHPPATSSSSSFGGKKISKQPRIWDHFQARTAATDIRNSTSAFEAEAGTGRMVVDLTSSDDEQWLSLSQDQEESRDPYYHTGGAHNPVGEAWDSSEDPSAGTLLWDPSAVAGPNSFSSIIREQINSQSNTVQPESGPTAELTAQCLQHACGLVHAGRLQPAAFFVRSLRRAIGEIDGKQRLWQTLLDEVTSIVRSESIAKFSFPLRIDTDD